MDARRAARAVAARRGELNMTQQELADAASVDIKTVNSFEARARWPIARTRARLEKELGWSPGELQRIADEDGGREPAVLRDIRKLARDEYPDDPETQQRIIDAVARELRGEPQPPPPAPAAGRDARRRRAG